jgi:membrane protease subunit (stomatin/prohibitin family)
VPLFEGHHDKGIQRLFIEIPDGAKNSIAYKWPDQQIIQHSLVNVDLDYVAVFTNLGQVIGILRPGRHPLDEGASLTLGWLVDRLTGDAYYDAELYFVTTRDLTDQKFGGPVDNLTDGPSGLVVSLRVFGELAFKVVDPAVFLARLIGTGEVQNFDAVVSEWVENQALAAVRAVLPDLVLQHGVLAMGQLQDATGDAALAHANRVLAGYGLQVTTFAQLNVNLPDEDAQQIKQLAAAKAYASAAGDFTAGVRGAAALQIAHGVEEGNVGAQPAIIAANLMGAPVTPTPAGGVAPPPVSGGPSPAGPSPAGPSPAGPDPAGTAGGAAHFCAQCGMAIPTGARFCPNCGTAVVHPDAVAASASAPPPPPPPADPPPPLDQPPAPGYWKASGGNWYPPTARPGPG